MNKRQVKAEAHSIVSALIDGAVLNMHDGWADDDADHERIAQALRELSEYHFRLGRKVASP